MALAGGGPLRTKVEIWADPGVTRNTHTITVRSPVADLAMTIENGSTDWNGAAVEGWNVTCTNVDFKYNEAWDGYSGGAVIAWGNYVGNGCRYFENHATDHGGAVWVGYNFTSTNETYIGNHAEDWGGAIFHTGWDEGQASVVNGKFMGYYYAYHHSGDDADYGGAIFNNDGNLSVTKSTFQSLSTDYRGGAIYTHADNVIRLTNNKFLYNDADGDGGAYFQWESTATEYFVGNEFTSNYSDDDGGAIYTASNDSLFLSNKFAWNNADDDGWTIAFENCGGEWNTIGGKIYGVGTTPSTGNNKWSIDGVDVTDMSATGSSPSYYDFDMLEEMQVTTGGADVTQQTGGVGINLVTKSGTDRLKGNARGLITDQKFEGDNITPALKSAGAGSGAPMRSGRAGNTAWVRPRSMVTGSRSAT